MPCDMQAAAQAFVVVQSKQACPHVHWGQDLTLQTAVQCRAAGEREEAARKPYSKQTHTHTHTHTPGNGYVQQVDHLSCEGRTWRGHPQN
eukprot:1139454-Pelagomonas_calceolata.AAC.9